MVIPAEISFRMCQDMVSVSSVDWSWVPREALCGGSSKLQKFAKVN